MEKKFKCGSFVLTNVSIKTGKGETYMDADQQGRIMVIDPSKAPAMYGIRRDESTIICVYVSEEDIRIDPTMPLPTL